MLKATLVSTAFTIIMCGITAGLYVADVHWAIVALPGSFSALLIVGVAIMWLGTSTIRVGPGWLSVRKGLLGIGIPKRIPFYDIRDIKAVKRGNEREGYCYNLVAVLKGGKDLVLASRVEEESHAQWLVDNMLARVGRTH
jgi:hypothetical protein